MRGRSPALRTRRAATVLAALALLAPLAACGSDEPAEEPEDVAASTPPPGTTGAVEVPEGTELTEPGTELGLGDTATVAYEATRRRGSVLELTVTRLREARIADFSGFALDERTRASSPYYVDVTVTNAGDGDLSGLPVPLWAVDGANTLVEASRFTAAFDPCPSRSLPQGFTSGESVETCLVYLVPDGGELTGVSYRPVQEFAPVVWTGEVEAPQRRGRGGPGGRGGQRRGGGGDG